MTLDKTKILGAKDYELERVEVPEWGGDVFVRSLSGTARDAFEQNILRLSKGDRNVDNVRARFLVLCLCDEHGNRLFDDSDVVALGEKSAAALDRLFAVAQRLNGMGDRDVEDLAKA